MALFSYNNEELLFDFRMVYQPKFKNDKIVGLEALCRPNIENVNISDLLGQLDDTCLFDLVVLERVLEDVYRYNDKIRSISVNIHPSTLIDDRFASYCSEIIKCVNVNITFELIETKYYEVNSYLLDSINKFKTMGFEFSLDDFGKDFSNDNALVNLPVSEVKVDSSLIKDIENNFLKFKYLKFLNEMLNSLIGKDLVFEGVENKRQLELIKLINGDAIIQGYYLSRPLELDCLIDFLDRNECNFKTQSSASYNDRLSVDMGIEREVFEYIKNNLTLTESIFSERLNCFVKHTDRFGTICSRNVRLTLDNYKKTFLSDGCYINNAFTNMLDKCDHLFVVRNRKGIVVYDNKLHQETIGQSLVGICPQELVLLNSDYQICLTKDQLLLESDKSFLIKNEEFGGAHYETIREKIKFNDEMFVLCSIYELI